MKTLTLTLCAVITLLVVSGCSETKDSAPVTQTTVSLHGNGFTDPSSANFHGKFVQQKNYDLTLCQSCHGATYAGGTTGQSCNTCHSKTGGPENCTTCHGSVNAAPPKDLADHISPSFKGVGAHQKHVLGGSLGAPVACAECHKVPATLFAAGHLDATANAEVRFDTTSSIYRSNAVYNAANVSCTNTYCHGNMPGGNMNASMTWTDTAAASTACGTCHGDVTKATVQEKAFPKTGHDFAAITSTCTTCHSDVISGSGNSLAIINPSRHMNGRIN
jgi:predicted CxxxxCH...CXXCH cytochrome family protein